VLLIFLGFHPRRRMIFADAGRAGPLAVHGPGNSPRGLHRSGRLDGGDEIHPGLRFAAPLNQSELESLFSFLRPSASGKK